MPQHTRGDDDTTRVVPVAGMHSPSRAQFESFLEEYADAPAYELTYTDDGAGRSRLVYDLGLVESTVQRPSARVTVEYYPLPPGTDPGRIALGDLESLRTRDPPRDRFHTTADRPDDQARALRRLAQTAPNAVAIPELLALLDRDGDRPPGRADVVWATQLVAEARPSDCQGAIPILDASLADRAFEDPVDALAALAAFADHDPGHVAPLVDTITPYLSADDVATRRTAARCLAAVAESDPDHVVEAVPALGTVLEDEGEAGKWAAYAISQITQEHPERVAAISDVLGSVVVDDARDSGVRVSATAALGRVTETDPGLAVDNVADIATLLDADSVKLRNNALALLGEIGRLHTDALRPYADAVAAFLTVDDEFARVNASWVLSSVATDFPDAVAPATPELRDCLDDEAAQVRANACYAMGHIGDESVIDHVAELAKTDDAETVRRAASISHDRLTE